MDFDGFPFAVAWELTLACNLRCRHCGSAAGHARAGELSASEALALCEQLPALLVQEVDFTGGEPLMREDWPAIAARLVSLGIRTQVITNGLCLTPQVAETMKDVGIGAVGVSLDGLEATHDDIRACPGLFRRAVGGIRHVLDVGIPVTVITTANARNLTELPALLDRVRETGVRRWQLQPIFPLGRSRAYRDLLLDDESYLALGRFVRQWRPVAEQIGVRLELADSYGYFTELDPRDSPWRSCPAGLVTVGITSTGGVKGCLSLPDEFVEGSIRDRDLWDIWFDAAAFAYTRGFTTSRLGPHCEGCDQGEICRGGCSAMSYGGSARFHDNPYCFYGIARHHPRADLEEPVSRRA